MDWTTFGPTRRYNNNDKKNNIIIVVVVVAVNVGLGYDHEWYDSNGSLLYYFQWTRKLSKILNFIRQFINNNYFVTNEDSVNTWYYFHNRMVFDNSNYCFIFKKEYFGFTRIITAYAHVSTVIIITVVLIINIIYLIVLVHRFIEYY